MKVKPLALLCAFGAISPAISTPAHAQTPAAAPAPHLLWYTDPAKTWTQALPVGNGRFGAMVFGDPATERLQLNDITVWSGGPQANTDRVSAYQSLPQLRQLLRDGKYADAERFANANFNSNAPYNSTYQTLGDLRLDFKLPPGTITDYRRDLDIDNAIASVRYKAGDTKFTREVFSSAADQVLVQHITADQPGKITFTLHLTRPERAKTTAQNDTLIMTGDTGPTLKYDVRAKILHTGGTLTANPDGTLTLTGADEATILITAATNYALDPAAHYTGGDLTLAAKHLDAAATKPYNALRAAHIAEYRRYFDRVALTLGTADNTRPTLDRLKSYAKDQDPAFAALFYQFGRYLLISSSRPDSPLPANLQGIWADGLNPPWQADYHTNINLQMNYWPAESANLAEMHLPMLKLTQSLAAPGSKTAKAYFGPDSPGWVLGYTTNAWGWTSPGKQLAWGIWFGGSGWLCQDIWEHYAFTRDEKFLRDYYPVLKGAAEFWLANLVEGADGKLITSPSSSPENSFTTDTRETSTVTEGATMERAIVWDLFDNTAQAAAALGVDADFAKKITAAQGRIRPLQIGKAGQLQEWNGDWDLNAREMTHRHVSHLFTMFPGHQITALGTPELAAAVKKSLELRGDDGTGWAIAWKENLWAHLHDGNHALKLIANQIRLTEDSRTVMANAGGTYPNLFDAHPPFQIDGNFGFTSAIDELLLQSNQRYTDPNSPNADRYFIDLLPALPDAWPAGTIKGLRARGGVEVAITWNTGKLVSAQLNSATGSTFKLRYAGQTKDITLAPGQTITLDGKLATN